MRTSKGSAIMCGKSSALWSLRLVVGKAFDAVSLNLSAGLAE